MLLIARKCLVGDPTVHDHQARPDAPRLAKQIGPDLGLQHDNNRGAEATQDFSNCPGEVERGKEDPRRKLVQAFFRHFPARESGSAEIEFGVRGALPEFFNQWKRSQNLPHRNCMQPNHAWRSLLP